MRSVHPGRLPAHRQLAIVRTVGCLSLRPTGAWAAGKRAFVALMASYLFAGMPVAQAQSGFTNDASGWLGQIGHYWKQWRQAPQPASATPRIDELHAVEAPDYGVALFDLFQDHYFSALSELAVAQKQGLLGVHEDEAQLLRAGLYVSFGLHDKASQAFQKVIDRSATPALRDRAWLYLGKMRYERGLTGEADEALRRIGGGLSAQDQDEFQVLRGNLLMEKGSYAEAAAILRPAEEDSEAATSRYARFNLAVALIRSGSPIRGLEILDRLGVEPVTSEDELALRDRANLALGLDALHGRDPERARFVLERIRLTGPYAARALLAYGWANQAAGNPGAALAVWSKMAGLNQADPAVMEGLMAGPAVLARSGSLSLALNGYGEALAVLGQEEERFDAAAREVATGDWIDRLVRVSADGETGWMRQVEALPGSDWSGELALVASGSAFQEAFKNYRDLVFLADHAAQWERKLDAVDATLKAQEQTLGGQIHAMHTAAGGPVASLRIDLAGADLARRQAQSGADLAGVRGRLQALDGRVKQLQDEQRQVLVQIATRSLQERRDEVTRYAHQARFAVAQLYDEGNRRHDAAASHPAKVPDDVRPEGAPHAP